MNHHSNYILFRIIAILFLFVGNYYVAYADEVTVLTASDITTDNEGKGDLVIYMDFDTSETIVGLSFLLYLPEGVDIDSQSNTISSKTSACKISDEVFELYTDEVAYQEAIDEGDYERAANYVISYLTLKERSDGGYLFTFIDQTSQTPLKSTHGTVITIPLKAVPANLNGMGEITTIGLSNNLSQGFTTFGNGDTIADVTFEINLVVISEKDFELEAPKGWTNAITNGSLASNDVSNFVSKEYPSDDIVGATIVAGAGKNGTRGIVVKSADETENSEAQDWDTQFWIVLNDELPSGSMLHIEFDFKASETATGSTHVHGLPSIFQHWSAIGDVNFTTEWQNFSADVEVSDAMAKGDNGNGTGTGLKSIAFNLAVDRTAVDYHFDNFGVWYQTSAPADEWTDIIVNGDMEGDDNSCFYVTEQGLGGPFLAKFTEGIGVNGTKAVKVQSGDDPAQDWDSQFFIRLPYQIPADTKYRVSFDYKADKAGDFGTEAHTEPGDHIFWACIGSASFTTDWQTFEMKGTISADMSMEGQLMQTIAFNLAKNKVATEFIFDNVKFEVPSDIVSSLTLNPAVNPTPYPEIEWTDIIVNGDMEGNDNSCFYVTEQDIGGPYLAKFTEGIGKDGSKAVKVQTADNPAQEWDSQFFIRLPYQIPAGTKYRVSFDYKADKAGDFATQTHTEPGNYIYWEAIGSGSFTTDWQTYEKEGVITDDMSPEGIMQTIAINLAKNMEATQFVFDNVKFEVRSDIVSSLTLNPAANPTPYPEMKTYTATFTTNAGWEKVYAYAWSGDGGNVTEFLGNWPGTELNALNGVYTVTIEAQTAPEFIIFDDGGSIQTADLFFVDGKAYVFTVVQELSFSLVTMTKDNTATLSLTKSPDDAECDPSRVSFTIETDDIPDTWSTLELQQASAQSLKWNIEAHSLGEYAINILYDGKPMGSGTVNVGQQLNLKDGWQWIALQGGTIGKGSLESVFGDQLDEARSETAMVINDPQAGYWGTLETMDYTETYKVRMDLGNSEHTYDIMGAYHNMMLNPITRDLHVGWNWVGNPYQYWQDINDIFTNGSKFTEGDIVKTKTQFATYTNAKWQPTVYVEPGSGMIVYKQAAGQIGFNSEYGMSQNYTSPAASRSNTVQSPMFNVQSVERRFDDNMAMIARVEGVSDPSAITMWAFVGDECRGQSTGVGDLQFITVHGQQGEHFSFKSFDHTTGLLYQIRESHPFMSISGSAKAPVTLHVGPIETAIVNVEGGGLGKANPVYDLQGRRVKSPIFNSPSSSQKKGIYIQNNHKVVIH